MKYYILCTKHHDCMHVSVYVYMHVFECVFDPAIV